MSYLYSKLPETGVSPHIGTGGPQVYDGGVGKWKRWVRQNAEQGGVW